METLATDKQSEPVAQNPSTVRQTIRFGLHIAAVYAVANITAMWLSGFVHGRVLPLVQRHSPTVSSFQFAFSHLFIFSFYPALAVSFVYAHWFRHKVAYLVWAVPLVILAYKFITFPSGTSVLDDGGRFAAAFHQYFAGDFHIAEFHGYQELFQIVAYNADMPRGLAQYRYTAPFYAGIGYSVGAFLGINLLTPKLHSALESMKPSMSSEK